MKRPLLGILAVALAAPLVQARIVNVADHGILPGKDVSYEVNALLEELQDEKGVTLFFPKGRYEFKPENAVEQYRAVTNHDNSLKRLAFPLFGFEDFTLDGDGSTFVFHGRICPITVEGSNDVVLKNFTIDWDTPFHHEFKVIKSDPKTNTFVAEVSPSKYGFEVKGQTLYLNHYNWQDFIGQNIVYDPNTGAPYWMTKRYQLKRTTAKAKKLSDTRVQLTNATKEAPPVGAHYATYGNAPTNRLAQSIHLSSTKDTYIENVTVYAGGGMALIAERADNVHLNGFVVTSRDDRILATRADATHFLGCKGLVKLENCRVEHMADDGINVHGAYIKVVEKLDGNDLLCEISHRQQVGLTFCEPGDKLMITSRETVLPIYETEVEKVRVLNEARMVITVTDLPKKYPKGPLSLENLTWYPDVELRNNIMRDNRARSALISTKGDVIIENNVFSSQMHGILIEGDNKAWYESGGVRNVVIKNNVFENIGYGSGQGYPLYASPMLLPEQRLGDDQYHWNVTFSNNEIKSFNGQLVHAKSVKNLVLSGNKIVKEETYPVGEQLPAVDLDYCDGVKIVGNEWVGFDFENHVEQKDNCSNVTVKKNKGLK
ncbi:right-handed parallel beta-helix repeat-containing protein [Pelagicoccus mobilis]|uniref:Right-handed parallel beta-helix repeat-containing protein n=1 Tax=Pelagicoccus mobilis TaxID=415221 RepID=A0A934VPR3_9BACT|nr:right-handed parallel beta-helix repeat-containing protein [Pelagicoccus mobilis]MBK1875798.1 right-handed parallel beta-helix repeat-containing protein [Pelagicoccus mobilis]